MTKHTVQKLRASNYRLDWANQPNPFLQFEGAPAVDLPRSSFRTSNLNFFETLMAMVSGWNGAPLADDVETVVDVAEFVSNLLYGGMAISAWKQVVGTDHRWALRVNASSGNLHPTDTAVLIREDSEKLQAGLYHYRADEHRLDKRTSGDLVTPLVEFLGLDCEAPPVVLCLSSTFFREAWKYRDRAFRYCQHDMGHALAALTLSAAVLGWTSRVVAAFPDDEVARFLGMEGLLQKPMAFVLLARAGQLVPVSDSAEFAVGAAGELPDGKFAGTPNKLTTRVIEYESIDRVYDATKYEAWRAREVLIEGATASGGDEDSAGGLPGPIVACAEEVSISGEFEVDCRQSSVHQTIRERRSAVDMDGKTTMDAAHLGAILRAATFGFAADFQGVDATGGGEWQASTNHLVHLYLYVHRVVGLEPGLYFFNRFEGKLVPLLQSDQRETAMSTSCFQEIAADGAFSISMIADFERGYQLYGERCYRLVHYEAGYIGQMLYLSAAALGYDATGIGCFLDDAINNYLGLYDGREVIYNFTIGKAVVDARLTTLSAYDFPTPY